MPIFNRGDKEETKIKQRKKEHDGNKKNKAKRGNREKKRDF